MTHEKIKMLVDHAECQLGKVRVIYMVIYRIYDNFIYIHIQHQSYKSHRNT